jgi:hypothetical protein
MLVNAKMIPVKLFHESGKRGIKWKGERGKFKYE